MTRSTLYKLLFISAMFVVLTLTLSLGSRLVRAAETMYYLDCGAGSDSNAGTSTSTAWKTLAKVNSTTFAPGDSILVKRGTICAGSLQPLGSGNASAVIRLADYGTGTLPIIDGGTNQATVKLFNQQYWNISNLEVRNGTTWGILVNGSGSTVLNHIYITNVVVHDVMNGALVDKYSGLVVVGYNFAQQFNEF
jgi:hypothetical protein